MPDKDWLERCKEYLQYAATDANGKRVVIVREDDLQRLIMKVVELEGGNDR